MARIAERAELKAAERLRAELQSKAASTDRPTTVTGAPRPVYISKAERERQALERLEQRRGSGAAEPPKSSGLDAAAERNTDRREPRGRSRSRERDARDIPDRRRDGEDGRGYAGDRGVDDRNWRPSDSRRSDDRRTDDRRTDDRRSDDRRPDDRRSDDRRPDDRRYGDVRSDDRRPPDRGYDDRRPDGSRRPEAPPLQRNASESRSAPPPPPPRAGVTAQGSSATATAAAATAAAALAASAPDRLAAAELELARKRYMGHKAPRRRILRPSEKTKVLFQFDWDATDDTSDTINPLYAQVGCGRGAGPAFSLRRPPSPSAALHGSAALWPRLPGGHRHA